MIENQKIRPAQVIGPLGEPLTIESLPPASTTRWVVRRKAEVVSAVNGGLLSVDEACDLRVGDAFLLCSDGLWAHFTELELGSLVHSLPPREACDHLVRLARERASGRGDNLSLAIVKLEAAPSVQCGIIL